MILLLCIIALAFKFKLMLIVIETCNFLTLMYIYGGMGLHNVSELCSPIMKALQPFIYSFGSSLSNSSSVFYDFSYTKLIFSIVLIQIVTLIIFFILRIARPI